MTLRWHFTAAILVAYCTRLAVAVDQPIEGTKLTLRRSSAGKEKLVFVSKDPMTLFPAIGSADDPGTGSPGGALLEIASTTEPAGVAFEAPPVVGKPGWSETSGNVSSYVFKNPAASPGTSAIRVIVWKEGKRIKVIGRGVGLALAAPQGAVGVRITTGSLRNCAYFAPGSVRHDDAGRFVAAGAPASGLTDCSSLLPGP